MNRTRLKSYLEVITNVAVLLVALVVLSVFAWSYFARNSKPELSGGFQRGQSIAQLPSSIYSNSPQTLILALNTKCKYCSESVPFYRHLAEIQRQVGGATRIVAIFPNTEDEVKRYARQNELHIETIPSVDLKALNLDGTPAIILVGNNGKVRDFWVGKLSKDGEQQVAEAISEPKV